MLNTIRTIFEMRTGLQACRGRSRRLGALRFRPLGSTGFAALNPAPGEQ